mmetsp:Transcript_34825/g.62646  ORF Transcript_34825/g.62646 Transcript_34825/m.62646 type:complete len:103 (-) Transcript_34825:41-349(-)
MRQSSVVDSSPPSPSLSAKKCKKTIRQKPLCLTPSITACLHRCPTAPHMIRIVAGHPERLTPVHYPPSHPPSSNSTIPSTTVPMVDPPCCTSMAGHAVQAWP